MSEQKTILLVEDDRHIALALRIRLSAAGYEVLLCDCLANARKVLAESALDVAVLDINLPDGTGLDLLAELQKTGRGKHLVCIIMTASKTQGLAEQAMEAGASAFLEKPFRSAELLDAINASSGSRL